MKMSAWRKTRQFVFNNLHNEEYETPLSRAVNYFLIFLILSNVVAVILESVSHIYQNYQIYFDAFEYFSIVIFTAEYLLRFWSVVEKNPEQSKLKQRWNYVTSGAALIDLLAILPVYLNMFVRIDLRFLRILRLFRLFKLTRYFVSLQILLRVIEREKGSFQAVIFILIIMIVMAAAGIYGVESRVQPEAFSSIPASMWWAVVTLTTVGYGDVAPVTSVGRFLGAMITILGVGLAALPAGILANGLANELETRKQTLELKFRSLLEHADVDVLADAHKLEELRKEVGLSVDQMNDITLQLLRERQEQKNKEHNRQYCFCPHCGHELPK